MTYELDEIKEIRKRFNLTQGELAKRAGVSQSLIAKIEAKRIDPTYSKTRKILDALESLGKKHEIKATSIMNKKIIPLNPNDSVTSAIKKMKKYQISQLPVIEGGSVLGLVSETTILDHLDDPIKLADLKIKDIMEDCPPVISSKTSVKIISNLLRHFSVVLLTESGKIIGLITKSDLLANINKI